MHTTDGRRAARILMFTLLGAIGCADVPELDAPEHELDEQADSTEAGSSAEQLLRESHDVGAPTWYVEPDLAGATFPLADDDPRAQLTLPEGVFVDDTLSDFDYAPSFVQKDRIGAESRTKVTHTQLHPFSSTVLLIVHFPHLPANAFEVCSGTMLSKDAVLTNGHCLFDAARQTWADSLVAIPGGYPDPLNASKYKGPFGSTSGKKLYVHDKYRTALGAEQRGHDFGVARLKTVLVGPTTRALVAAPAEFTQLAFLGYHGDLVRFQMYHSPGKYTGWFSSSYGVFKTDADTFRGASGSGVALGTNIMQIIGVMQGGLATYNVGIAFNAAKRDKAYSWVNAVLLP
jgi:V8-like Glu-specific endopeptidase